jgi:hypothetical protein
VRNRRRWKCPRRGDVGVGQAGAFEGLVARGKPLVGRSADAAARDGQMRVREGGGDQALGQKLRALMHDAIRGQPREAPIVAGVRYRPGARAVRNGPPRLGRLQPG